MKRIKLHHRIPFLRRPYLQRDQARLERDRAIADRDEVYLERDRLIADRDQARLERDRAIADRDEVYLERDRLIADRDQARLERDRAIVDRDERLHAEGVKHRFFVPPGHFYSPIVDTSEADAYLRRFAGQTKPRSVTGINLDRSKMLENWDRWLPFFREIPFPSEKSSSFRYAFINESYSWGDGSVLYAILRHYTPSLIIEVGSGWSSACTVDTIERYLNKKSKMISIDPYPQLARELVGKTSIYYQILETPIQQVSISIFEELAEGDILFIDSTHVLRAGSDVCFELFEVLPRLAPGVLVHFHDIFWPFEYPRAWVIDENRSWNELYAIRAFLTNNADWNIIFFNDYFAKTEEKLIADTYPNFLKNCGGALWLQRSAQQ